MLLLSKRGQRPSPSLPVTLSSHCPVHRLEMKEYPVRPHTLQPYDQGARSLSFCPEASDYLPVQLGDRGSRGPGLRSGATKCRVRTRWFACSECVMQRCASKLFPVPGVCFHYPVSLVSSWVTLYGLAQASRVFPLCRFGRINCFFT